MGNGNAIQTIGLTKCFKTKIPSTGNGIFNRKKSLTIQAIDNLNLEIKQGQLFGLLGPSCNLADCSREVTLRLGQPRLLLASTTEVSASEGKVHLPPDTVAILKIG